MSAVTPIRTKPHFYLGRTRGPWLINGEHVEYRWLPYCKAHNRWPCKQCGTSHFKGCDCDLCPESPSS